MTSHRARPGGRRAAWLRPRWAVTIAAAAVTSAALALITAFGGTSPPGKPADPAGPAGPAQAAAHPKPGSYLGVYTPASPGSYQGVSAFTAATGVEPKVVVYYSGWLEPFQARFAAAAARHRAVALVQIDPTRVSLAAIASGQYDSYLHSYAAQVKSFGRQVILSFGHEMNGYWYSWGHKHTAPAVFVQAWRHIVTVFRAAGATNVTWLWTVNVIDRRSGIPSPDPWWPGGRYVNWVGIDGYYYKPSWRFAPLFGPTIKAIRRLTLAPVLITETAATPAVGQPAKVADLFAGIRAYGLLGFVWFNVDHHRDWRLRGQASIAAYRRGAQAMHRTGS